MGVKFKERFRKKMGIFLAPLALAQSIANAQLDGGGLEQWNIDCPASVERAKQWILERDTIDTKRLDSPEFGALQHQLSVCTSLFNTPGNPAYRDCPDYSFFESLLGALKTHRDGAWWREQLDDERFTLSCLQ